MPELKDIQPLFSDLEEMLDKPISRGMFIAFMHRLNERLGHSWSSNTLFGILKEVYALYREIREEEKMKDVTQGIFRVYHEKRSDGSTSKTRYEGIFWELNPGTRVIIARLSHGLRVLPAAADEEYLVLEERFVELDPALLWLAKRAFWPDQNLQRSLSLYESALLPAE
jgi:hypothetical protein